MRIYYDIISKNIVLGNNTRLFATGSLEASEFRGRVSVVYKNTNFRELFIKFEKVLKQDGTRAGLTIEEVITYLNIEFNKTPFGDNAGENTELVLTSGQAIIAYKLITTNSSGLAVYASSDDLSSINKVIGVSKNSAITGDLVYFKDSGLLTNTGWNWVPGQLLYLGLNGDITSSVNTGIFSNIIGYATTNDSIFINIGRSIVRG